MPSSNETTLIVTGPPASGKSTVINWIYPICDAKLGDHLDLRVDTVLRQMYESGDIPSAEMAADGALFLHEPNEDTQRALDTLLKLRAASPGNALIEIPLDERWLARYLDEYPRLASGTSVLCLTAPLEVRLARNDHRGVERIPPANLAAMLERIPSRLAERIQANMRDLTVVDTDAPPTEVRERTTAWVLQALDGAA